MSLPEKGSYKPSFFCKLPKRKDIKKKINPHTVFIVASKEIQDIFELMVHGRNHVSFRNLHSCLHFRGTS